MNFEKETNEVLNIAIYLQFMGSFVPNSDFTKLKNISISTYDFIKNNPKDEVKKKLPSMKKKLEKMAKPFLEEYPIKISINEIATNWNSLFKNGLNFFSYGITYGWLEEQMDLSNLIHYEYVPYNFNIGLGAHKSFGQIEEEFLLGDAFKVFIKSEYYFEILNKYGNKIKEKANILDNKTYKIITDIKFEVISYSRLSVISFYAFFESFVNSVGFSYLQRNKNELTDNQKELLEGFKKGRYVSLKYKIEHFQKIISKDSIPKIITSDPNQIAEPFKAFFEYYEEIRNSAVHYSPKKERIWLKPADWFNIAEEFSKLTIEASKQFWKSCYSDLEYPEYLNMLDYDNYYENSKSIIENLNKIIFEISET